MTTGTSNTGGRCWLTLPHSNGGVWDFGLRDGSVSDSSFSHGVGRTATTLDITVLIAGAIAGGKNADTVTATKAAASEYSTMSWARRSAHSHNPTRLNLEIALILLLR